MPQPPCRLAGGLARRWFRASIVLLLAVAGLLPADRTGAETETPTSASSERSSNPSQWMRLVGIDQAEWARLQDVQPWSEQQKETLQKILMRLAGLPPAELERWAHESVDWKQLVEDPAVFRGQLFRLRGRVRSVERLRPPAEIARRFQLKQYYRVELVPDGGKRPVVIFTRTVPKSWRRGGPIDQPGGAWGMFLKLGGDDPAEPRPVFAAGRLAWYPDDRLLGRLGMDVGLLDELADRRPIDWREEDWQEGECFYRMLAAVGRAGEDQLSREARRRLAQRGEKKYSVEPLFNRPAQHRGALVILSGTVRRALRVRVEDLDIRRRFGIDHYYELYLYTDDSQGNPLVFCVRRLPEGMPTGQGPEYAEPVSVAGFFLKSWAYRPVLGERCGGGRGAPFQLAPLLVGREPVWHEPKEKGTTPIWGILGAAGFVLLLLGIWLWLAARSRADRRFRRETLDRYRRPADAGLQGRDEETAGKSDSVAMTDDPSNRDSQKGK